MRGWIETGTLAVVSLSVVLAAVQSSSPARTATAPANLSADAEAVLDLDRQAELALNRADTDFLDKRVFADDMIFTHGDAWTKANTTGNTNTKDVWLSSIKRTAGQYSEKHANLQRIEMHDDMALVEGRSSGKNAGKPYEIWYLRVYNKRAGEWKLISHKTVRGPQDQTNPTSSFDPHGFLPAVR